MNRPSRCSARLVAGFLAIGAVATALLIPISSAQAATTPGSSCTVQLTQRNHAHHDLRVARARYHSALKARRAARSRYHAAPTRRHHKSLIRARRTARTVHARRTARRYAYDAAAARYATCVADAAKSPSMPPADPAPTDPQPSVSVTNPRVEFHGSDFAVADVTWTHIPLGQYQYVVRYDDQVGVSRPVTFVDVVPPQSFCDLMDPDCTPVFTVYWQNDVTYPGTFFGGGCDYTPGQNATFELWNTAGVKVASATVDNPCR